MNTNDFLIEIHAACAQITAVIKAKNADYSPSSDPFSNFKMCEDLGLCSLESGILVRMTDKLARITNLISQRRSSGRVKDESISDTLQDLAAYALILKVYLERSRKTPARVAEGGLSYGGVDIYDGEDVLQLYWVKDQKLCAKHIPAGGKFVCVEKEENKISNCRKCTTLPMKDAAKLKPNQKLRNIIGKGEEEKSARYIDGENIVCQEHVPRDKALHRLPDDGLDRECHVCRRDSKILKNKQHKSTK